MICNCQTMICHPKLTTINGSFTFFIQIQGNMLLCSILMKQGHKHLCCLTRIIRRKSPRNNSHHSKLQDCLDWSSILMRILEGIPESILVVLHISEGWNNILCKYSF